MDPNRLWPTSTDESNSMISVIITAYNRRDYLIDAMNSVLSQTLKKERYEVIVVKNFYDKELDEFIYKNGFISIFFTERSQGKMLYEGIKVSSGYVISLLDDDDLFLPDKLEHIYSEFRNNSNLSYLHNGHVLRYDGDDSRVVPHPKSHKNVKRYLDYESFQTNSLKMRRKIAKFKQIGGDFNSSSISFKKSILDGKFHLLQNIKHSIDTFLFCSVLVSGGELLLDSRIDSIYRISKTNTTGYTLANLMSQDFSDKIDIDSAKSNERFDIRMSVYLKELLDDLNLIKFSILNSYSKQKTFLDYQIYSVSLELKFTRTFAILSKDAIRYLTLYLLSGLSPSFVSSIVIKNITLDALHFFRVVIIYKYKMIVSRILCKRNWN